VYENQQELEWNVQLLVYAVDVSLLGENINITRENTDAVLVINEEFQLEVYAGKKGKLNMCSYSLPECMTESDRDS
jgi:hypothetical protein